MGRLLIGLALLLLTATAPAEDFSVVIEANQAKVAIDCQRDEVRQEERQHWDEYFSDLFDFYDSNRDGFLDAREAKKVPSAKLLRAIWRGDFDNLPAVLVTFFDQAKPPPESWRLTKVEFATYFLAQQVHWPDLHRKSERGILSLKESYWLYSQIASADNQCHPDDFRHADRRLRAIDANDDERWSMAELQSAAQLEVATSATRQDPIIPQISIGLTNAASATNVSKNMPITRVPLHMRLSSASKDPRGFFTIDEKWPTGVFAISKPNDGVSDMLRFVSKHFLLSLQTTKGTQTFNQYEYWLPEEFGYLDLNNDGALDNDELERSKARDASRYREAFGILMTIADRNGDGRLSLVEAKDFLAMQKRVVERWVTVTVADAGIPLFAAIDTNNDGTLSLRELKHGWAKLVTWDQNGDGQLDWEEIPHQFNITWSIGPPAAAVALRGMNEAPVVPAVWFQKMDLNRDGDVSRREFLGPAEVFRRLDKDGDELISPAEASAPLEP